jgi:hypothetical protein
MSLWLSEGRRKKEEGRGKKGDKEENLILNYELRTTKAFNAAL